MLHIQCLKSKRHEANNLFSRFVIGPLEKGQGLTIGNALRRVLLSDLEGLAIAGVRITDVNHEFSTIEDVKEDIIDILLNIKQITLKGSLREPGLARLTYNGPGIITAKNIELPEEISLVEPNQYIASVNTSRTIEMEFIIKNNKGYCLKSNLNNLPQGFLAIDAIYMPVKKVNFFIETSNNNDNILADLESLILEVYTNGSITPIEAIGNAAEILQDIFNSLKHIDSSAQPKKIVEDEFEKEKDKELNSILIEELELSVRAFNCLKRANIHTLKDLLQFSKENLLEFKNFGQKSADEVSISLGRKFGKNLKQ